MDCGPERFWQRPNPDLWSRFNWAFDADGAFYYCQTAFDATTEKDALAAADADSADMAGGCGGFSWTELRSSLAIEGTYQDEWGSNHEIDAWGWTSSSSWGTSSYAVSQYDNDAGWIVAQNDSGNDYNPDLWSRFNWTTHADGSCFTAKSPMTRPLRKMRLQPPMRMPLI